MTVANIPHEEKCMTDRGGCWRNRFDRYCRRRASVGNDGVRGDREGVLLWRGGYGKADLRYEGQRHYSGCKSKHNYWMSSTITCFEPPYPT